MRIHTVLKPIIRRSMVHLVFAVSASTWAPVQLWASSAPAKDPNSTLPALDNRYQSLETLARGMYYLETMYVDIDKVNPTEMATNALRGVIE